MNDQSSDVEEPIIDLTDSVPERHPSKVPPARRTIPDRLLSFRKCVYILYKILIYEKRASEQSRPFGGVHFPGSVALLRGIVTRFLNVMLETLPEAEWRELVDAIDDVATSAVVDFTFRQEGANSHLYSLPDLTPTMLGTKIMPLLSAVSNLQHMIDDMHRQDHHLVRIRTIMQFTPVTVSIEGVAEAIKEVQELIEPWRKTHAKAMAQLTEQEKLADIETRRAEVLAIRARALVDRRKADEITGKVALMREKAERIRLKNEKVKQRLRRDKIELAFEIIDRIAPNLEQIEKVAHP